MMNGKLKILVSLCLSLACLASSGCSGLLGKTGPAPSMYVLSPKSTFNDDISKVKSQLVIMQPTTGRALDTDRIAVRPVPEQFEYYADARWTGRAPMMIQTLLVESFENTGKIEAVGRQAISLRPDYSLVSELREFQAELYHDPTGTPEVVVRMSFKLVNQNKALILDTEVFGARVKSSGSDMRAIVRSFDEAMGKVLKKAVGWCIEAISKDESAS